MRLVGQVTNPPKVVDLCKAESELDTVKVGIVTSMVPVPVQDLTYQFIGTAVCYDEVVQRIRAAISNKVAMSAGAGPTPTDV